MGIADCHGIESFSPIDQKILGQLVIRAESNQQRHSVVYIVKLNEAKISVVEGFIKQQEYHKALQFLQDHEYVQKVGFPHQFHERYQDHWKVIPNDKLDPYWREEVIV